MPLLEIETWDFGGAYLVACRGEIDVSTVARLRGALRPVFSSSPYRVVHVDLAEVTFFATAGLEALLDAAQACKDRSVQMSVTTGDAVDRILSVTGWSELESLGVVRRARVSSPARPHEFLDMPTFDPVSDPEPGARN